MKNRKHRHAIAIVAAALTLLLASSPALGQSCHEAPKGDPAAAAPESAAPESAALEIPDVPVFDQDGKRVMFYSDLVRGKVVVMNFVFTTCTTICPPMGANFSRLQDLLGDRLGKEIHLISVSVDPVTDTPARLNAWGAKFRRRPGWTLVTGSKSQIDMLLKALKIFTPDKNDHSPIVLMGDEARGAWTRAYGLAAPDSLLQTLNQLAAADAEAVLEGGRR